MNDLIFKRLMIAAAASFTLFFCIVVLPPLFADPDVLGAFAAGFVNPYASGYATDVFFCWAILAVWVVYESRKHAIKNGWVCLVLGIVPGVAVGFALYLLLRHKHFSKSEAQPS